MLAIAQLLSSKELLTAETTSSSNDKNVEVNISNEPAQNHVGNLSNPLPSQTVDKGKEIKANKTPTEIEKSSSDQHPEIFFENPDFNFGMIYKGQKVEHIYKFENRGKDILKISKVKTSCGCTAAILTNKTVLPGETGEIKATYNSGSYGGNVKKTITVTSNDPNSPKYKLSISGEIKEEISVKPKSVNFGSIYVGKEIERTIAIKPLTDSSLNIKKITSSKEFVKASIAEKNKDGYIIKATLDNNLKIGRFSGGIFLETDNQRQPKVKIPFFGEVVGDITPYPKKIYYGFVNKGKEITRKVFVKINKDDIKILNIKISPDFLSTKIIEKKSPHYLIEVKLNKEAAIGKLNGLLELDTNSEKQPVIRIPILGEIKEAAIGKLNGLPELNTKSEKQPVKRTPVFGEG